MDEIWDEGSDCGPGVAGVEPFLDSLGQPGNGISMLPKDSEFGSDSGRAYLNVDVSTSQPGTLKIYVWGWDLDHELGNPDSLDIEINRIGHVCLKLYNLTMTITLISLIGFSVAEWGVIDIGTGKAISSAGATGEETEMPVVKAPVIYFYGSIPKEITLSLDVSPEKITLSEPAFTRISGKPSWKIKPYSAKKGKPEPLCWTDPEASLILANDHTCDYIFYEAEVSYENKVRILKEGDRIGFLNSGKYPVYDVIYLIGYPGVENGIMLFYYIPALGPSETVWPDTTRIPSENEIRARMVSAGLSEGATEAFLGEWWPTFTLKVEKEEAGPWFQEGSLITSTFAYRLSGEEVEKILPMSIKPKPEKTARVWWVLMK